MDCALSITYHIPKLKQLLLAKSDNHGAFLFVTHVLKEKPGKIFISISLYKVSTFNNNVPNTSLTIYIIDFYVNKENIKILVNFVK